MSELEEARKGLVWLLDPPRREAIERLIRAILAEERQATPKEDALLTEGRSIIGMEEPLVAGIETTAEERSVWSTELPIDSRIRRLLRDYARLEAERDRLRTATQAAADALFESDSREWASCEAALARLAEQGIRPTGAE